MSLAITFKALADPVRRRILTLLKTGPLTAGDITKKFDLTDATISHHLSVLKSAELIEGNKKGTFITYQINTSVFEEVMSWIISFSDCHKSAEGDE